MLDGRFVDQILLLQRLARGGIEDLFLDLGMDLELLTDLLRELLFPAVVPSLFELVEEVLHLAMVGAQELEASCDEVRRRDPRVAVELPAIDGCVGISVLLVEVNGNSAWERSKL